MALPAASSEPLDPALVSPWWAVLTSVLCVLAGVLLVVFVALNS